ncbi:MAG: apolipoprotein N-acyltransferase [Phycisphaerales bacterium]|nr:apolipoprotein N-acyltransferase [Phycisphaerales bacterium]
MTHETRSPSGPRRALLLGVTHALLMVLSFPPYSLWGLAFVSPIPLFVLARDPRMRPSRAAFWCAIGVCPAWLWLHWWVWDVSALGIIPLVIVLSLFSMLYVWLASRIVHRFGRDVLLLPLVFVGVEFFRGSVFGGGYPWYLLAHPLVESPLSVLAMPASIAGVYFVSFLCATYSYLLYLALRDRSHVLRKRAGQAAAGLFAAWVFMGLLLIPAEDPGTPYFRFAVVQPDVAQDNRLSWSVRQRYRDWLTLRDITLAAASDQTNPLPLDAIIWPEGFVPGWTLDPISLDTERAERLAWNMTPNDAGDVPGLDVPSRIGATEIVDSMLVMQQYLEIPLVVGSVAYDNLRIVDSPDGIEYERDALYNSAFVIMDGRVSNEWYDKLHLTPFGETMPLISRSEWLEQNLLAIAAQGMEFALDPGREARNLRVPLHDAPVGTEVALATPICFEATISGVCRKLVARDGERKAGVLINITNDGWFGDSLASREAHLQNARWRCIELGTPMIRSANTGISAVIDHRGRIVDTTIKPLRDNPREGYLINQVQLGVGMTTFARMGDLFGWLTLLLTLVWGGAAIFRSPRGVLPMQTESS